MKLLDWGDLGSKQRQKVRGHTAAATENQIKSQKYTRLSVQIKERVDRTMLRVDRQRWDYFGQNSSDRQ